MLTRDSLFNGRLICYQQKSGYRFAVDSVLVAHFLQVGKGQRVLDLGTGSGVISLIAAYRFRDISIIGLEKQAELFQLALKNSTENNMDDRFSVLRGDLCAINTCVDAESFDCVISNPPYTKPGTGRVNNQSQSARARHEIDCTLADVVKAAFFAVKNRGSAVFVYPARRAAVLVAELVRQNLMPKRIQPVYSYPEDNQARLVLVEAVKNGGEELHLMPPFFIYTAKDGPYTSAMQALYE